MEMIPISAKTSLDIFLYVHVYKASMYFLKGDRVLIVWKIDVLLTPPPPRYITIYHLMILQIISWSDTENTLPIVQF